MALAGSPSPSLLSHSRSRSPLSLPSSLQLKWRRGVFCSRASVPLISPLLSSSLPSSPCRLFLVSPAARKNHLLSRGRRRYFSGCKLLFLPSAKSCLFVFSFSYLCRRLADSRAACLRRLRLHRGERFNDEGHCFMCFTVSLVISDVHKTMWACW